MMVTCPECNGRISSQADLCPHCGYMLAGLYSRENAEKSLSDAIKAIKEKGEWSYYKKLVKPCNNHLSFNQLYLIPDLEIIHVADGVGFTVSASYKCHKCGKKRIEDLSSILASDY